MASLKRWNAVDPLAEKYLPYSGYNYVLGNPLKFIDPDGMQVLKGEEAQEAFRRLQQKEQAKEAEGPIYGKDGKLIGYEVESGQGPTQIAQDLNQYYSCDLTCEITFTDIVNDNKNSFENVFGGLGEVNDKSNNDYLSGNIKEGDILIISQGKDPSIEMNESKIKTNLSSIDSILDENKEAKKRELVRYRSNLDKPVPGDPRIGPAGGSVIISLFKLHKNFKNQKKIQKLKRQNDSLNTVNKLLTKPRDVIL